MENGVMSKNISRIDVPGSFELIFGSKKALESKVDVVVSIEVLLKEKQSI